MRFLLLIPLLLISACIPLEDREELRVKYVIDGDTFTTKDSTIRVWGIDAPERDEPYYKTSTAYLNNLIEDATLTCTLIDIDKYDRDVMRCYLNKKDISALMVKAGMARDYTRFSDGYYEGEEEYAIIHARGIWKD